MNFDTTDLKDNILIIKNEDGSIICIPREGSTDNELKLFKEFETEFPNGKPEPEIPKTDPIPTTEEKLIATQKDLEETQNRLTETRASLENMNADLLNFILSNASIE